MSQKTKQTETNKMKRIETKQNENNEVWRHLHGGVKRSLRRFRRCRFRLVSFRLVSFCLSCSFWWLWWAIEQLCPLKAKLVKVSICSFTEISKFWWVCSSFSRFGVNNYGVFVRNFGSFCKFVEVFFTFSDQFGLVRTLSDMFGCKRMRLEAFSENIRKFWKNKNWTIFDDLR